MARSLTDLALRGLGEGDKGKEPLVELRTRLVATDKGLKAGDVEVEANLDPVEVMKAAVLAPVAVGAGVLTGGILWTLWNGVELPTGFGKATVWPGLKQSPWWRDRAEELRQAFAARRQARLPSATDAASRVGEFTCEELRRRAGRSFSRGRLSEGRFWTEVARQQGCEWAL